MFVGLRLLVMPFLTVELPVLPEPMREVGMGARTLAPELSGAFEGVISPTYTAPVSVRSTKPAHSTLVPPATTTLPTTPAFADATLNGRSLLMLVWGLGVVIMLGKLGWACFRTRQIIARAGMGDGRLMRLAKRAGALYGMTRDTRVGVSEESAVPFVYGAWKPAVILPRNLVERASDEELLVVLAHEFAHTYRRDSLLGWVFALCHAFYFFHPVLPFVKRKLLLERERACDNWVLSLSNAQPSAYARILVSVAELCGPPRQPVPVLIAGETFQDLRTRLHGLRDGRLRVTRMSTTTGVAMLVTGLLAIPGIAFTQASPSSSSIPMVASEQLAPEVVEAPPEDVQTAHAPDLPIPRVAVARVVESPPAVSPTTVQTRTLRFPSDRSVGILKVRDNTLPRHRDDYSCWNDWEDWSGIGSAQGIVTITGDKDVWLTLNAHGFGDTSFLRALEPDAIYRLSNWYGEEGAPSLDDEGMADVARLSGLRHLELRYTQVTDRGLELIQALPHLERLETPGAMTDIGLAHISNLGTLQGLYIHPNKITDAGLVHVEKLQGLREMILGGGDVTDAGLVHLKKLPNLDYLMLWGKTFGDAGMSHVAGVPALTTLNANRLNLSNKGIQNLAASPSIETLNLHGVKGITGLALQHLANLKTLRKLNLSSPPGEESKLNSYSMTFLANCTALEVLDLPSTIDDAALAQIAKLPNLTVLRTWGSSADKPITDRGLFSIASIEGLRELFISGQGITDLGVGAVAGMRNLESLSLFSQSQELTNEGVATLANLSRLNYLAVGFNKRANVTLSALSQLKSLTSLTYLQASGFHQDDSVLDLSTLENLTYVAINIYGGMRDEDLVCLSELKNLRWLQGVQDISDAGAAHIAKMTNLDRLNIRGEGLTDAALEQFQNLTAMDMLTVEGSFTDSGLQKLRALQGLHFLTVASDPPLSQDAQERLIFALPNLTVYNQSPLAGR
jgi:beta-lactamase regulating signal transducer with metallopeptidase domain